MLRKRTQQGCTPILKHSGFKCRVLLDKKQQKRKGTQEVLAALSFLEEEERTGRTRLDITEFRYIVTRFGVVARLHADEVPVL